MIGKDDLGEVLTMLKRTSVATAYSLLGESRSKNLLSGIKPLLPNMKVVGTALTIEYKKYEEAIKEKITGNAVHDAHDRVIGGEVIVAASLGRSDVGVFGDCITFGFKSKGAAGIVVDGGIRDSPYIMKLDFPVFARNMTPEHIGGVIVPYRVNVEVSCAGVQIKPGDIIMGDSDGVICIPKERGKEIAIKAEEIEIKEEAIRRMIASGIPLRDSYPPRPDLFERFLKK
ncbi:RraA family protein [Candidatus Bathyarchaeota archaeon]|nr:RraA family protein [Candidatus Bathyarchaeota archaeon]MBS7627719.1 RraA family protein [Candidatus Bathyarchaeota archaeon]